MREPEGQKIVKRLRYIGCKTSGCELLRFEAANLIERQAAEIEEYLRSPDYAQLAIKQAAEIERLAAEMDSYKKIAPLAGKVWNEELTKAQAEIVRLTDELDRWQVWALRVARAALASSEGK